MARVRQRRLSTDDEYLQKLQDSSDIDDGYGTAAARRRGQPGGVRALRTQSISGSVLNTPYTAPVHSDDIIVMDFGSHSLKAGRARDEFPVHVLRSLHPQTREPLVGAGGSGLSASAAALSGGGGEELGESWKVDWGGVDELWRTLFEKHLRIDPACHDFIVTEPPDAHVNGTFPIQYASLSCHSFLRSPAKWTCSLAQVSVSWQNGCWKTSTSRAWRCDLRQSSAC